MAKKIEIDTHGKHRCWSCGEWFNESDFYKSISDINKNLGILPYCKSCVSKEFDMWMSKYNNEKIATYKICGIFNIPFYTITYEGALESARKRKMKVFQAYFSKINSFGDVNGYGQYFFEGEEIEGGNKSTSFSDDTEEYNEDDLKKAIKYWGKGKEFWEYKFLEEEIYRLQIDFECSDYGMEMILKDIALLNLDTEKIRCGILKGDLLKTIEARSRLMNDGNLKPIQSTGADKNERISFGVLVKKWENEKPVKKKMDDEMKRYIDTYMVGHLAKMEGLNNEAVKKYEEAIDEFTIDIEKIKKVEDDE